jgi:protein-L-isoaspartate O-methyltransferase
MKIIHKIKLTYFWHIIDILSFFFSRIGKLYEQVIGKEYKKEIEKFGLSNSKNILHIGCGVYPITALILAHITSAQIVSIDKNPLVVNFAKKLINKKNLQKKVKIKLGNGQKYEVKEYDAIIVSSCSSPKDKIMENIFKNADLNTKIVVREIEKNLDSVLKIINSNKNIKYQEKIKNISIFNFNWYSFYLIKK